MENRNKPMALLALGVLCASSFFLLSGFVPQDEGPSIRHMVMDTVITLGPADMPAPIVSLREGKRLWSVREPVAPEIVLTRGAAPFDGETGTPSAVRFAAYGVRLETDAVALDYGTVFGPAPMAPLLALDGASQVFLVNDHPGRYGDALDELGRPVRWFADEAQLSGYSSPEFRRALRGRLRAVADAFAAAVAEDQRRIARAEVGPAVHLSGAAGYREIIAHFARRYSLDASLVSAIIHSESNFRPTLVSSKSAMGLMQVLPSTAGGEIHRFLYGRAGSVSFDDLRRPETNILYGTTYLHILMTRYFSGVRDAASREYLVTASYNMGPNRVVRLYGRNPAEAAEAINVMDSEALYRDLLERLPRSETRAYVAKVRRIKGHYAALARGD
ncbi:MAG: transglycosylase SLT domain-containing protein [Desulfovibrio sp.]|nr:transglycosylase SLT domain-containing protein [Desulfovibrio sp.]